MSGTHYAAWASDADHPERERAAAMAKGFVAEAANLVTAECIQIHGGVGFTWDVDCHLLYRRAKQDDVLFGAQGYQRERLADLSLGPVGASNEQVDRLRHVSRVHRHRVERPEWWRSGVLYQIYPRSFADSNADGVGDLPGVIAHLDHLAWLGSRRHLVEPDNRLTECRLGLRRRRLLRRGPGSTGPSATSTGWSPRLASSASGCCSIWCRTTRAAGTPGSRAALADRDSPYRDYYVWHDPRPDGEPPNNWVSSFGGPAWTLDESSGQWYLHNFLPEQPDLNWWNDAGTRRVRQDPQVLVRPRCCRVPHRRVPHDREGRGAPRQPADHRGRPVADAGVRPEARVQRLPARGPRRAAQMAPDRRRSTTPRGFCSARRMSTGVEDLVPFYGVGTTS